MRQVVRTARVATRNRALRLCGIVVRKYYRLVREVLVTEKGKGTPRGYTLH
jgi:hypothetical protein